jgi:hypothetical protein
MMMDMPMYVPRYLGYVYVYCVLCTVRVQLYIYTLVSYPVPVNFDR